MISNHQYALKLETLFRIGDNITVSADRFQQDYHLALEEGLSHMSTKGIISPSEFNMWLEEYSFDDLTLGEIIDDLSTLETLQELFRCLQSAKQKWMEE